MTATTPPAGTSLTPQQLAAVVAAVELVWPAPLPAGPIDHEAEHIRGTRTAWRFSGRWWSAGDAPRGASGT